MNSTYPTEPNQVEQKYTCCWPTLAIGWIGFGSGGWWFVSDETDEAALVGLSPNPMSLDSIGLVSIEYQNPKPSLDSHLLVSNVGDLSLTSSYSDQVDFDLDGKLALLGARLVWKTLIHGINFGYLGNFQNKILKRSKTKTKGP